MRTSVPEMANGKRLVLFDPFPHIQSPCLPSVADHDSGSLDACSHPVSLALPSSTIVWSSGPEKPAVRSIRPPSSTPSGRGAGAADTALQPSLRRLCAGGRPLPAPVWRGGSSHGYAPGWEQDFRPDVGFGKGSQSIRWKAVDEAGTRLVQPEPGSPGARRSPGAAATHPGGVPNAVSGPRLEIRCSESTPQRCLTVNRPRRPGGECSGTHRYGA